jgi:hypothetical protein
MPIDHQTLDTCGTSSSGMPVALQVSILHCETPGLNVRSNKALCLVDVSQIALASLLGYTVAPVRHAVQAAAWQQTLLLLSRDTRYKGASLPVHTVCTCGGHTATATTPPALVAIGLNQDRQMASVAQLLRCSSACLRHSPCCSCTTADWCPLACRRAIQGVQQVVEILQQGPAGVSSHPPCTSTPSSRAATSCSWGSQSIAWDEAAAAVSPNLTQAATTHTSMTCRTPLCVAHTIKHCLQES